MIAKEILHLNAEQRITSLFVDEQSNHVLIGLNDGRIIKASRSVINSYATGKRVISAVVKDSYGNVSNEASLNVLYLLRNAILKTDENAEVLSTWKANCPYSAIETGEIQGIFTSQPLWAGEDFIFWKEILWDIVNPTGTKTILQVRSAPTSDSLENSEWKTFTASSGQNFESLDSLGIKNSWLQIRCVLKTSSKNTTPILAKVAVVYRTKFSVCFYTTKFIMERDSNLESGLLIANMDVPRNTEVKIGIIDSNSSEWNGYQIIESEKSFLVNKKDSERIKIGFKLISNSPNTYATIDEFALMLGGEKMEILKKT